MLNRFKNALYGSANISDNESSDRDDYRGEPIIGKRIRNVIKRSTSFQEDLTRRQGTDTQYNHIPHRTIHDVSMRLNFGIPPNSVDDHFRYSYNRNSNNHQGIKVPKFRYSRPEFLQLKTDDEILVSADHQIRPIILPRDTSRLPWKSGYAECINAGKSKRNEDQAACYQDVIIRKSSTLSSQQDSDLIAIESQIPWFYFGIFDGHAGDGVSTAASLQLHNIIGDKLSQISDLLIALEFDLVEEFTDRVVFEGEKQDSDEYTNCQIQSNGDNNNKSTKINGTGERNEVKINGYDNKNSETITRVNENEKKLDTIEEDDNQSDHSQKEQETDIPNKNLEDEKCKEQTEEKIKNPEKKTIIDAESGVLDKNDKKLSSNTIDNNEQNKEDIDDKITNDGDINDKNVSLKEQQKQNFDEHKEKTNDENIIVKNRLNGYTALPSMIDIFRNNITVDKLIVGALESAFWEMDEQISRDKDEYKMAGGCTAIVGLFILGKLYVCNAGDSRAIVYKNNQVIPMSFDFTPTSERERILKLGLQRPELLGSDFTHLEFLRRPSRKDLGKQMLYRDAYMTGWSIKKITYDDLKFPLVWGEGKRSRVLATIGVTRGFGDHELRAQYGNVFIKPFLTPEPEVKILPLEEDNNLTAEDVLIIGSDGLWDVTTNEEAAEIVKNSFDLFPDNEESRSKYRYITAAQDLVIHSRGQTTNWNNVWRQEIDGKLASLDDIAVFVIPLKQYRDEYIEWKQQRTESVRLRKSKMNNNHTEDEDEFYFRK